MDFYLIKFSSDANAVALVAASASVLSALSAGIVVWFNMHDRKHKLATQRPYVIVRDQKIESLDSNDDVYIFKIINIGNNPAQNISVQSLICPADLKTKGYLFKRDESDELPKDIDVYYKLPISKLSSNFPSQFICCKFKYQDAVTGKSWSNIWYRKWDGVKDGQYGKTFDLLNSTESNLLKKYLKENYNFFL